MSSTRVVASPGRPLWNEPAPEPHAFVIFGATGDLTRRKLVPGLYNLLRAGRLPEPFALVGVSRDPLTAETLRRRLRESTEQFSRSRPLDPSLWERLARTLEYVGGDLEAAKTYRALRQELDRADRERGTRGNRLYYLAVPPHVSPVVLRGLHDAGLLHEHRSAEARPWCRVVVEKPFGRDLASAQALNRQLGDHLEENQIFRIDHYLGKETVQNILVFRFGNAIFEPIWNRQYIDHVQITAAESIGIEGRGRFFDSTGTLRDVVQSHLLLVLTLCAAEPPISFAPDDARDEEVQVLRALHPLTGSDAPRQVVRAQYRGYRQEEGASPSSRTETYLAMKVSVDNWRWQSVPFYLRAGKRLAARRTEIDIHFQPVPLCLFRPAREGCHDLEPNVLSLRIQPDEGISLRFAAKVPGDQLALGNVQMDMSYASAFGRPIADAYERLLLDVMRGDPTLFARRDMVEEAWRFVTPILEAWEADTVSPIPTYEPGSQGPPEADELIGRDGRAWRPIG